MIELPWPPKELSPNARIHHFARAAAARHSRESAHWLTVASRARAPADGPVHVDLTFHPPDRRRRDLDGMFSSMKSALDGVADALEVNDHRFEFTLRRAEPVAKGKVVIVIGEGE